MPKKNKLSILPTSVCRSDFISEPKTVIELEHNAQFQFDNVSGWMSVKDYDCALIKARCLVDALEKLVMQSASQPSLEKTIS